MKADVVARSKPAWHVHQLIEDTSIYEQSLYSSSHQDQDIVLLLVYPLSSLEPNSVVSLLCELDRRPYHVQTRLPICANTQKAEDQYFDNPQETFSIGWTQVWRKFMSIQRR